MVCAMSSTTVLLMLKWDIERDGYYRLTLADIFIQNQSDLLSSLVQPSSNVLSDVCGAGKGLTLSFYCLSNYFPITWLILSLWFCSELTGRETLWQRTPLVRRGVGHCFWASETPLSSRTRGLGARLVELGPLSAWWGLPAGTWPGTRLGPGYFWIGPGRMQLVLLLLTVSACQWSPSRTNELFYIKTNNH